MNVSAVAVLMSVYRADTKTAFSAAIQSVVGQEGVDHDIRIYLAIDGPLDSEVEEWIAANAHCFYIISRSDRNIGLAASLNRLITMLKDENYVFRMDSDDTCLPDRFSRQLGYLDNHSEVDILGGAVVEHDTDTGSFRVCQYPLTHSEIVKKMVRLCPFAHPTVVFRKRVLTAVGGYPEMKTTQDLAMWFACLQKGFRFANLPDPLVIMEIDSAFFDRRSLKKGWNEFRIYLKGIKDVRGYSYTMIYPVARLLSRLAPIWVRRRAYRSSLRRPQTSLNSDSELFAHIKKLLGNR